MLVKDLKWYSPFVFLVGAILSFADPITDILTLVEFYCADHKAWFGVGLTFVLLPCLAFLVLFLLFRCKLELSPSNCAETALCALHPFSAAFARIQALLFCLKKCWSRDEIDPVSSEQAEDLFAHISFAVLFEAVLESAPQFIIQLYAISVQEEPAAIIQIISLPISFLTLVWAFTATDKWSLDEHIIITSRTDDLNVKHRLALYVTNLLLLSSRLSAICYFTVSYKWWVISVVMFHSCAVVISAVIWKRNQDEIQTYGFKILLFMGINCFRDDFVEFSIGVKVTGLTMSVFFSHILFVLENFFMILMFYFTYHPKAWYSFPVTVFVCVFSVLGSTMRICLLRWLSKGPGPAQQPRRQRDVNTCVVKYYISSV